MNRENFLSLLDEMFELTPGTLKGSERLDELTWDSMAMMSFIALVDEQCGVALSPKQFAACATVEDLIVLAGAGKS